MNSTETIALERINNLFRLAEQVIHENPERAQRYIHIARKIGMRTRIKLPKKYKSLVCKKCKRFILPGVNSRTRIQQKREAHMVITCLNCGAQSRVLLKGRQNSC
jgi:ribonuclease P protein subunit RPR2